MLIFSMPIFIFVFLPLITRTQNCNSNTVLENFHQITKTLTFQSPQSPSSLSSIDNNSSYSLPYPANLFVRQPSAVTSLRKIQCQFNEEINFGLDTQIGQKQAVLQAKFQKMKVGQVGVIVWLIARNDIFCGTIVSSNLQKGSITPITVQTKSPIPFFSQNLTIYLNFINSIVSSTALSPQTSTSPLALQINVTYTSKTEQTYTISISLNQYTRVSSIKIDYIVYNLNYSQFASDGGIYMGTLEENNAIFLKMHKNFAPIKHWIAGTDMIKIGGPQEANMTKRWFDFEIDIDDDFVLGINANKKMDYVKIVYLMIGNKMNQVCSRCENGYAYRDLCVKSCPYNTYPYTNYGVTGKSCQTCSQKMNQELNNQKTGCVCQSGYVKKGSSNSCLLQSLQTNKNKSSSIQSISLAQNSSNILLANFSKIALPQTASPSNTVSIPININPSINTSITNGTVNLGNNTNSSTIRPITTVTTVVETHNANINGRLNLAANTSNNTRFVTNNLTNQKIPIPTNSRTTAQALDNNKKTDLISMATTNKIINPTTTPIQVLTSNASSNASAPLVIKNTTTTTVTTITTLNSTAPPIPLTIPPEKFIPISSTGSSPSASSSSSSSASRVVFNELHTSSITQPQTLTLSDISPVSQPPTSCPPLKSFNPTTKTCQCNQNSVPIPAFDGSGMSNQCFQCQIGSYKDTITQTCASCPMMCLKCHNSNSCIECQSGYVWGSTGCVIGGSANGNSGFGTQPSNGFDSFGTSTGGFGFDSSSSGGFSNNGFSNTGFQSSGSASSPNPTATPTTGITITNTTTVITTTTTHLNSTSNPSSIPINITNATLIINATNATNHTVTAVKCSSNMTLKNGKCQCDQFSIPNGDTECFRCVDYSYKNLFSCEPCLENCVTCNSTTDCIKCAQSHIFNRQKLFCQYSPSSTPSLPIPIPIPTPTPVPSSTTASSPASCPQNKTPDPNNPSTCICDHRSVQFQSVCVPCPTTTFKDAYCKPCQEIDVNCQECDNATYCIKCFGNLRAGKTGKCQCLQPFYELDIGCGVCPNGLVHVPENKTCSAPQPGTTINRTTTTTIITTTNTTNTTILPPPLIPTPTPPPIPTCSQNQVLSSSSTCICNAQTVRHVANGPCVPCDAGTFRLSQNTCLPCIEKCLQCTNVSDCQVCITGYRYNGTGIGLGGTAGKCQLECKINQKLVEDQCLCLELMGRNQRGFCQPCPIGTVVVGQKCQNCSTGCEVCQSPTRCTKCYVQQALNLLTLDCCKLNQIYNTTIQRCQCKQNFKNISGSCGICPQGLIYVDTSQQCRIRSFTTNSTTTTTVITNTTSLPIISPTIACLPSEIFINNSCQCPTQTIRTAEGCKKCPPSTYPSPPSQCLPCMQNCLVCTGPASCLTCQQNYKGLRCETCAQGSIAVQTNPVLICQGRPCGNGRIDGAQECDDGNTNNGDGCGRGCLIENGWVCGTAANGGGAGPCELILVKESESIMSGGIALTYRYARMDLATNGNLVGVNVKNGTEPNNLRIMRPVNQPDIVRVYLDYCELLPQQTITLQLVSKSMKGQFRHTSEYNLVQRKAIARTTATKALKQPDDILS